MQTSDSMNQRPIIIFIQKDREVLSWLLFLIKKSVRFVYPNRGCHGERRGNPLERRRNRREPVVGFFKP